MTSHILGAEWDKARSVRSTWATVAGSTVFALAFAAIVPLTQTSGWDDMTAAQRADVDPTGTALVGVLFAAIFFGALAVRSITGEHATGMISTTFLAMPGRAGVLVGKAAVAAGLALVTGVAANTVAFTIGQGVLGSVGIGRSLATVASAQAIAAGTVALALVAVLGVGLGALFRRTTPAVALLVTALIGSQLLAVAIPTAARPYIPGAALQATVAVNDSDDLLGPLAALAVLAAYAAAVLALAAHRIGRQDA
jgi:ABC-2 type transport system permease protein